MGSAYVIYKGRFNHSQRNLFLELMGMKIKKRKVSGFLILNGDTYLHYLEGAKIDLVFLFNYFMRDPRHNDIEIVDYGFNERKLVPNWYLLRKKMENEYVICSTITAKNLIKLKTLFQENFGFDDKDIGIPEVIKLINSKHHDKVIEIINSNALK